MPAPCVERRVIKVKKRFEYWKCTWCAEEVTWFARFRHALSHMYIRSVQVTKPGSDSEIVTIYYVENEEQHVALTNNSRKCKFVAKGWYSYDYGDLIRLEDHIAFYKNTLRDLLAVIKQHEVLARS